MGPVPDTHDDAARSQSLLSPELPFLYLVIPLPAAYLLGHNLLEKPVSELLGALLEM